jgi:hypothetical protein
MARPSSPFSPSHADNLLSLWGYVMSHCMVDMNQFSGEMCWLHIQGTRMYS